MSEVDNDLGIWRVSMEFLEFIANEGLSSLKPIHGLKDVKVVTMDIINEIDKNRIVIYVYFRSESLQEYLAYLRIAEIEVQTYADIPILDLIFSSVEEKSRNGKRKC